MQKENVVGPEKESRYLYNEIERIKKLTKEEREILKQEKMIEKALKQIKKAEGYIAFARYHINKVTGIDFKCEDIKKKASNLVFDLNNTTYYLAELKQYISCNEKAGE